MCSIFRGFEIDTSEPRLKALYFEAGETEQQHRRRLRDHQAAEAQRNRLANAIALESARRVAERRQA